MANRTVAAYEAMGARIRAGDLSDLIAPLDYRIMETLPDEGTNIGGLYQIGETVQKIRKKIDPAGVAISPGGVAIRVKILIAGGLAVPIPTLERKARAYQLTKAGREVLAKWQQSN